MHFIFTGHSKWSSKGGVCMFVWWSVSVDPMMNPSNFHLLPNELQMFVLNNVVLWYTFSCFYSAWQWRFEQQQLFIKKTMTWTHSTSVSTSYLIVFHPRSISVSITRPRSCYCVYWCILIIIIINYI